MSAESRAERTFGKYEVILGTNEAGSAWVSVWVCRGRIARDLVVQVMAPVNPRAAGWQSQAGVILGVGERFTPSMSLDANRLGDLLDAVLPLAASTAEVRAFLFGTPTDAQADEARRLLGAS